MKIDVEGAESLVLCGAEEMLKRCRPEIQFEATTPGYVDVRRQFLEKPGYVYVHPKGFRAYNHLFVHSSKRHP